MDRYDQLKTTKGKPHFHTGIHAERCCEHKFGDAGNCCHLNGVQHSWNKTEDTITEVPEIIKVEKEENDVMVEPQLKQIQEMEEKLKTNLHIVKRIREKIELNLAENQKLLDEFARLI